MRKENSQSGIGFVGLLQIAFIILKLCGVIDWPWLMVFVPVWGGVLLVVAIMIVVLLAAAFIEASKKGKDNER